jgi:hypothetical protein
MVGLDRTYIPQRIPVWGIPGTGQQGRVVNGPQNIFYVDAVNGNNNNEGTSPQNAVATLATLMTRTWSLHPHAYDTIYLLSDLTESVITPTSVLGPNYINLIGRGPSARAITWTSALATTPCLDLRAMGWRIENIRFRAPVTEAALQLRYADTNANDIAARAVIQDCVFDGNDTGRYGICAHGAYDVQILNCVFQQFHNAVGGGAVPLLTQTNALAVPFRNRVIGCTFQDSDNGMIFSGTASLIQGNIFQVVGPTRTMTLVLQSSTIAMPGIDNIVTGNLFPGDYSIVGGYRSGVGDVWSGNIAEDVAEPEVSADGWTLLPPA